MRQVRKAAAAMAASSRNGSFQAVMAASNGSQSESLNDSSDAVLERLVGQLDSMLDSNYSQLLYVRDCEAKLFQSAVGADNRDWNSNKMAIMNQSAVDDSGAKDKSHEAGRSKQLSSVVDSKHEQFGFIIDGWRAQFISVTDNNLAQLTSIGANSEAQFKALDGSSEAQLNSVLVSSGAQFKSVIDSYSNQLTSISDSCSAQYKSVLNSSDAQFHFVLDNYDAAIKSKVNDKVSKTKPEDTGSETKQAVASWTRAAIAKDKGATNTSASDVSAILTDILARLAVLENKP